MLQAAVCLALLAAWTASGELGKLQSALLEHTHSRKKGNTISVPLRRYRLASDTGEVGLKAQDSQIRYQPKRQQAKMEGTKRSS